jgi:hypothetical protein
MTKADLTGSMGSPGRTFRPGSLEKLAELCSGESDRHCRWLWDLLTFGPKTLKMKVDRLAHRLFSFFDCGAGRYASRQVWGVCRVVRGVVAFDHDGVPADDGVSHSWACRPQRDPA